MILSFHFDLKKETQDWYEVDFKDFSEVFETLEIKIKEKRAKHDERVKGQQL
ncbi:hypothetical protein ACLGE2_00320 [Helicobacter pylori]